MFLYATCACHVSKDHLHHCNTSVSFFFSQVLGQPPVIKQSTGKPPFVNDFAINTSTYLYIYMDFQLPCLMTRRYFASFWQFCLRFLVENMRKYISPTTYPRKFLNRKVANAPLLHDISMVDRFKPRYLGTHSKAGQP